MKRRDLLSMFALFLIVISGCSQVTDSASNNASVEDIIKIYAADGSKALIGSWGSDGNATDSGTVYAYSINY